MPSSNANVAQKGDGVNGEAVFYDVVDINPDSFEIKKAEPSTAVSTNELSNAIQEGFADDKVAQKDDAVKYPVPGTDGDPVITEKQKDCGLDAGSEVSFSLSAWMA